MTDGPFKNTSLSARWKAYGELLDKGTFNVTDRVQQAQKALIEDLAPPDFKAAVRAVFKELEHLQSQLFPGLLIDSIINKQDACEQSETFRKHIHANLRMQADVATAIDSALTSTFESGIGQANQRLVVHCIEVDEKRDQAGKASELKSNHSETFAEINPDYFKDAMFGKVSTTTSSVPRIEDGPPL
jgi:hypothetical protein